jgi:hypothetical protein
MIILLKLSKKIGFGSKKQYHQDPTRPKGFRIRPDPNPQRPDHTTIKISQQNEDHNNRHWATIVEKFINDQKIMIFSHNESSSQHSSHSAELTQFHLLAITAYR